MKYTLLLFLGLSLLPSCRPEDTSPEGRYRSRVTDGLSTDEGPTETVLGIQLATPSQAFFDRCTELNRQQLITMGTGSNTVDHALPSDLGRPAVMSIQPEFTDGAARRVASIQVDFHYLDWSPWNRSASADSLLPDVVRYLGRTVPVEFDRLDHPQQGTTYVSVDGKRLLAVWKLDDSKVRGMFTDLSIRQRDPLQIVQ